MQAQPVRQQHAERRQHAQQPGLLVGRLEHDDAQPHIRLILGGDVLDNGALLEAGTRRGVATHLPIAILGFDHPLRRRRRRRGGHLHDGRARCRGGSCRSGRRVFDLNESHLMVALQDVGVLEHVISACSQRGDNDQAKQPGDTNGALHFRSTPDDSGVAKAQLMCVSQPRGLVNRPEGDPDAAANSLTTAASVRHLGCRATILTHDTAPAKNCLGERDVI